jgi:hypothetical protein
MKRTMTLKIPKQMRILCAMMEIEPETMLQSFADDLTIASEGLSPDDRRKMATNYLMRCSVDNEKYKQHQIDILFEELNTLLEKWPNDKSLFKEFFRK